VQATQSHLSPQSSPERMVLVTPRDTFLACICCP